MKCEHMNICLIGNEETGVASIDCEDCGRPLIRREVPDKPGYTYFTQEEWEEDGRRFWDDFAHGRVFNGAE